MPAPPSATEAHSDAVGRVVTAFAVQDLMARLWLEAEKSVGARADTFFVEDGAFIIEGLVEARGRDAIRRVGAYREEIGPRHSRHLMTNYAVEPEAPAESGRVVARAVMTHFGGTGSAPLPLERPLGIYDVTLDVGRDADGRWWFHRLHMRPIFMAAEHPARNMPRSFSHPNTD